MRYQRRLNPRDANDPTQLTVRDMCHGIAHTPGINRVIPERHPSLQGRGRHADERLLQPPTGFNALGDDRITGATGPTRVPVDRVHPDP